MEIKAKAKFIRISPRKVRLIVDAVRGLAVEEAINQLHHMNKRAALTIKKLIDSAIANAVNTYELKQSNLFVKIIEVSEGPTLKRWMPRARGRATPIRKRTSHISLILGELVDSGEKIAKKQDMKAPIKLGEKAKEAEGVKVSDKKDDKKTDKKETSETGKKIIDPRSEGKGKNAKNEGKGGKGVGSKFFRRKSG